MAGHKTKKLGPSVPGMPAMVEMDKRKPRSRLSLNLDREHGHAMPGVKIGQNHKMTVRGRVASLSSDEYGHRVELDVRPQDIEHGEDDEPQSLTRAMKRRNRHMRSGRFTA